MLDYVEYSEVTTLLRPMDFSIEFDTGMSGWSIVYIEGLQVIIQKNIYFVFSEDQFCLDKQCTVCHNTSL